MIMPSCTNTNAHPDPPDRDTGRLGVGPQHKLDAQVNLLFHELLTIHTDHILARYSYGLLGQIYSSALTAADDLPLSLQIRVSNARHLPCPGHDQ